MPIMEVHYPDGCLGGAAKAALAARLTEVLIRMEGGADTAGGQAFAWVLFRPAADGDFWIGGKAAGQAGAAGGFVVHVSIPEGYMNRAHKDEVHRWVASAIQATAGADDPTMGLLTVIHEVPEGNWGSRGVPISLETIAEAVGQPADGPRVGWSRAYFGAKARALAMAGYPPDTGGVLPSLEGRLAR